MFFQTARISLIFLLVVDCVTAQKTANGSSDAYKIYEDLPLDVAGNTSVLRPAESITDKIKRNLFIKTIVSKKQCYAGEPLSIQYQLYSALQNKSAISKRPSFAGFTVRKIEFSNDDGREQILNGKNYRVFTADQNFIIPYQTGTLTLESMEIHNTISYEDDKKGPQHYEGDVRSEPLIVSVSPLPTLRPGEVFCGAIGNFSASIQPDKTTFAVNESNRIVIELTGNGNLSNASLPYISWPGSFDVFHGAEHQTDSPAASFYTKKQFTITVVAKKQGTFTVEPISFTTFNPGKGKYEKIVTPAIEMKVQNSTGNRKATTTQKAVARKKNPLWIVGTVIMTAITVAFLVVSWQKKRARIAVQKMTVAPVNEAAAIVAPDYVSIVPATLHIQNDADFVQALKSIIRDYLAYDGGVDPQTPMVDLVNSFSAKNASQIPAVQSLLNWFDQSLYAQEGLSSEVRNRMVEKVQAIVKN